MKDTNYIQAEIEIREEYINKNIRIINSFEEIKREKGWSDKEDDYKYENEKEIKKCKIKINEKIILIFINLKKKANILLNIYLQII